MSAAWLGMGLFSATSVANQDPAGQGTPPVPGVVAKVGDEFITDEQLVSGREIRLFGLQARNYRIMLKQLNKRLTERLFGDQAKKHGLGLEEYITEYAIRGRDKVSTAELKKHIADLNLPDSRNTPELRDAKLKMMQARKREELIDRHLEKLKKAAGVVVYLEAPKLRLNLKAGEGPTWGSVKAPVELVEFTDFQCPYCAYAAIVLKKMALLRFEWVTFQHLI